MGQLCDFYTGFMPGFPANARWRRWRTRYRDGTTHVLFEPLDFIARPADLVPKSHVNLTPFRGVFAPNSSLRSKVTLGDRARRCHGDTAEGASERRAAMSLKPSV